MDKYPVKEQEIFFGKDHEKKFFHLKFLLVVRN